MKRRDLQGLAALRLREARLLLSGDCPEGAYYLAGYAAECAIKACIAKQTERHEFPDLERVKRSWTHKLDELVQIAGLKDALREAQQHEPELNARWQVVQKWTESSRYRRHSGTDAEKLLDALEHPKFGVIRWLKRHW